MSERDKDHVRRRWYNTEDEHVIFYTTESDKDGKFWVGVRDISLGYKAVQVYERSFTKRSSAKARALALYAQHSPKYAAKIKSQ